MLRIALLFLVLTTPASALDLETFQNLAGGDASPISETEAEGFAQTLCTSGLVSGWGRCRYVQERYGHFLLFEDHLNFKFQSVLYGSFTKVGRQEVLVGLVYAETDVVIGSDVLFRRAGRDWQAVRFMEETLNHAYLMFPTRSGRTILVGRQDEREFMRPEDEVALRVVDIRETKMTISTLFSYKNQFLSCQYPPATGARYVEIMSWKRQDVNEDGFLDLIAKVSETELSELECDESNPLLADPRRTTPVVHELVFLFDGETSFDPTPETAQIQAHLTRFTQ